MGHERGVLPWPTTGTTPDISTLVHRPQWMTQAACQGEPLSTFVPERGAARLHRARALCGSCPVRVECFTYAMADDTIAALWAGTLERDRRRLRRVAS